MRAIAFGILLAAISSVPAVLPAAALTGGTYDVDTAAANATVKVEGDGMGCTGTLIAPTLVLTAGHCRRDMSSDPEVDGTHVPMGQWAATASTFTVRVGADLLTLGADRTFNARFVSQAGWADIILLQLDRPVPGSLAIPVPPLTRYVGELSDQNFTLAGYAGETKRRVAGVWHGAFPCKTNPNVWAGREFFCALFPRGVAIEEGDSGGPIYWTDKWGKRYVIGAAQRAVDIRLCPDLQVPGLTCGSDTFQRVDYSDPNCAVLTPGSVTASVWSSNIHTSTFNQGGPCWRDLGGISRHEPNIARWLENALRWEPSESSPKLQIVLQNAPDRPAVLDFALNGGYSLLSTMSVFNANAPYLLPAAGVVPLWSWQVGTTSGPLTYTTRFPGHAFSRPTLPGGPSLLNPAMVGFIFDPARPQPPNTTPLTTFVERSSGTMVTTWDLALVVPNALARRGWDVLRLEGYLPQAYFQAVLQPQNPLPIRP